MADILKVFGFSSKQKLVGLAAARTTVEAALATESLRVEMTVVAATV
jgi:hypothetical protein